MITIVNLHTFKSTDDRERIFYVGRRIKKEGLFFEKGTESILGNKFFMQTEADREIVIKKYKAWIWEEYKKGGEITKEIHRILEFAKTGDITLACWCAPKHCHADVIRSLLEYIM